MRLPMLSLLSLLFLLSGQTDMNTVQEHSVIHVMCDIILPLYSQDHLT